MGPAEGPHARGARAEPRPVDTDPLDGSRLLASHPSLGPNKHTGSWPRSRACQGPVRQRSRCGLRLVAVRPACAAGHTASFAPMFLMAGRGAPDMPAACRRLLRSFVDLVGGELLHDQRMHAVLLGVLGGRPRGRFRAVIAPRVKISPPQTPCGSWRSSAPARQEPRIGQGAHCALASSRSPGRSENHSCGLCRWHGSSAPVACACRVSRATEFPGITRHRLPGSAWAGRAGPAAHGGAGAAGAASDLMGVHDVGVSRVGGQRRLLLAGRSGAAPGAADLPHLRPPFRSGRAGD